MRTSHHDFHLIYQAGDNVESLSNGQLSLLEREPIETLENGFDFVLPQKFLHIFFCIT
jgi:hypothetical protein